MLAPGLIDLRVKTGEPGAETKETLASAAWAAAAGGVTSFVVQPDTDPAVDDPSVVDFILRRSRDIDTARILCAGAATKGLEGEQMAEIGLMREAGCVYVTDADKPIVDSKVMQRILTYAKGFDTLLAHRPTGPLAGQGRRGDRRRVRRPHGPALDLADGRADHAGARRGPAGSDGGRLLVDQVTSAQALETLARAKAKGLRIQASVSINHLSFNELDIGDYRSFAKVTPPLRGEDDRQALIEALASGLIDIVISAHAPAPAEDKRRPFDEAAPGRRGPGNPAAGPAEPVSRRAPAAGRPDPHRHPCPRRPDRPAVRTHRPRRPADLVLCDLDAPLIIDAGKLLSKSKNSPFDGRRLQGQVLMTIVDGAHRSRREGPAVRASRPRHGGLGHPRAVAAVSPEGSPRVFPGVEINTSGRTT